MQKARLPAITEKAFQAQVQELAALCGWNLRYHTFDSRRSTAGFPDLVLVKPPRVIFAELKVGKRGTSTEQKAWLEALASCGMSCYVWRPELMEEIRDVLTGRGNNWGNVEVVV